MELLKQLLSSDFMPHGFCYLWDPRILWLHVISDGLITLSYYCIPVILVYFIRKNRDLPFNKIFWMFGTFILACGTTHLMEIWNIWHASYLIAGLIKAITAAVSVLTMAMLIPLIPKVMSLPERAHLQEVNHGLEREITAHKRAEEAVRQSWDFRPDPRLVRRLNVFTVAAPAFSAAVGLAGLAGWALHIPSLTTWGVAPVTMKATTCVCFVLISVSLWLSRAKHNRPFAGVSAVAAKVSAIIVAFAGLLSLGEKLLARDFRVDQSLRAASPVQADAWGHAGLMSPLTAAALLLLALALLALDWRTRQGRRPTQILTLSACTVAAFGILSFVSAPHIYVTHLSLSLPTAVTLTVISLGLICARTEWGLGSLLCSQSLGGSLARRLLPAPFIPPLVSWIRWQLTATGLYSEWSIVVMASLLTMSLLAGLFTWAALAVNRSDVQRRKAEEVVKESLSTREAALKELSGQKFALDQHAIVAVTDVQGTINYVNDKFCTISGYSKAELLGQNHRILNSGHHPKEFFQEMYRTIANGKVWHGELKNRAKDGSIYWVDTTIVPFLSSEGKPQQYIAIRADITERKRAEEALRESEERFQSMVNSIPQLAWMAEADGHIFWYNQRWYEYTGTTLEQMEGWAWQTVHDPAMLPKVLERWQAAIAGGIPFEMEFPLRGADGRFGVFLTRVVPAKNREGRVVRWFGTNTDITELRRAEEVRERLAAVVESSDDAIISKDRDGTITAWNHAAEKMFGYSSSEAVGNPIQMLIPPERAHEEQDIQSRIGRGESVKHFETVRVRKDGTYIDVSATISPIRNHRGEIVGASKIARDITESKRAEETLKESLVTSERALKELADQKFALDQHAIVAVTDVQGTITYVNDKFCAISQYSKNELIGQNHRILNSSHHPKEFFQQMYHTIANGKVWHGEIKNRAKDGSIYWVDTTVVPFVGTDGKPRQYVAIRADITERKRAEEALRESLATSERALKDLADQKFALDQHAIVAVTDVQGTITYVNDKFCSISKFSKDELIGQNHRILNSGHHSREFFQEMYHTIAKGKVWHGEIKNRAKDGAIYWVDTTIVPTLSSEGKPRQYVAIRADITERKRAEEELHESQERFRLLLDGVKDYAIYMLDPEGHVISWNAGAARIKGYRNEEILGKHFSCFYIPEDRKTGKPSRELQESLSEGRFEEQAQRVRKDGSAFWANVVITPMYDDTGKLRGFSKVARDITERKRAEDALRESLATSETALKELADQKFALDQHAIVAVTDVQGTITYVNDKFCTISQYSENELIGQNHRILNSGHHPKEFFQQMYHSVANGKVWHGEIKNRAKDGSIYWVDTTIVPTLSVEGKPRQYIAIRADITERKRAADALAEQTKELSRSQQALEAQSFMLQSVLDNMAEGLVAADEHGKFLIWNRAAERIVGYGPADISTSEWSEHYGSYLPDGVTLFPTQQLPLVRAIHGEASTAEMFLRSPKVTQGVWIEASGSPLRAKDGTVHGGVVAFRDITKRKADELQIQQLNDELEHRVAERTAQLETANKELEAFSYSVSHDLRAPLRHIGGFSKMLAEEFGAALDPEAQRYVERIQAGTQKMGLLVDELLNLARVGRHALNRQPIRLNAIISEVIAMLQPDREGRQVEWVIAELPLVECDPVLVKQIFQNLLANALKFTRSRAPAIIEISHKETADDQGPVFMIRDNGIGFNMKYVDKLFGVFQRLHSTEDFEGTGIGLVTVQRIVHKHGGRVWAEGEVDKGAAFCFTLGAAKQGESKSSIATAGGQS